MLPSNQLPNPESEIDRGWAWLKSRIDRTVLLEAAHELDEWIAADLQELERSYVHLVTAESIKVAAGSLVSVGRRK